MPPHSCQNQSHRGEFLVPFFRYCLRNALNLLIRPALLFDITLLATSLLPILSTSPCINTCTQQTRNTSVAALRYNLETPHSLVHSLTPFLTATSRFFFQCFVKQLIQFLGSLRHVTGALLLRERDSFSGPFTDHT